MRKGRITTTIALMLLSASLMFAADAESLYSDFHQAVDNGDVAQAIETYDDLQDRIAREADEKVADARAARDSCRERIDALEESLAVSAREREADRRLIEELRMKVEMLTSGKTSLESDNARLREKIADSERMVDRLSAILSSKLNASGADEEQEVKED